MESIVSKIVNKFTEVEYNRAKPTNSKDHVQSYCKQLLTIGAIYLEFADSVREGNGERVIRCLKYLAI